MNKRTLFSAERIFYSGFIKQAWVWFLLLPLLMVRPAGGQAPVGTTSIPKTEQAASETTPAADPGAQKFLLSCAGCHTIGHGPQAGPDLSLVRDWKPADIARNIKRMQERTGALSDKDVALLVDLLKDSQAQQRLAVGKRLAAQAREKLLSPPSPESGKQLFLGQQPLKNGGIACSACHSIQGQGGSMAVDLTGVAKRLGDFALTSAIERPGFKYMKEAFNNHPVTPQEAAHLASYLASVPATAVEKPSFSLLILALAGAVVLLGVMAFAYRNNATGVRSRLTRR